jgi:hypothetical protein
VSGQSKGPVLAEPRALGKVGEGVGARISETLDTTGKAIAAVAGLGIFFFATGYFVEWQRLRHGGLPPEQVLPLLPKAQIVAAGVRELAISVLFGGAVLVLLGVVLVGLARATKSRSGRLAKRVNRALQHDVFVPTLAIGLVMVLIVPFNEGGLLVAAIVTCLLSYGLHLVHAFLAAGDSAKFPLWRLTIAIAAVAIVLSGARQHEFPEPRAKGVAELTNGGRFKAGYVASDAGKVIFRKQKKGEKSRLIVFQSDELERVILRKGTWVLHVDGSLIDWIVDPVIPDFQLSCIPPECLWSGNEHIGPSSFF